MKTILLFIILFTTPLLIAQTTAIPDPNFEQALIDLGHDDGYLAAASSQASIQNQIDEQAFRDYYTMRIQNPYNISSPRTIRLGIKFDF